MVDKNKIFSATDKDFEDDNNILNYRPKIEYVQPPQEAVEHETPEFEAEDKLGDLRAQAQELIDGYKAAIQLADIAQQRINDRVKNSGGVTIKLDPVKDQHIVAAIKRRFPEKADPSQLTYDDYLAALDCVHQHAISAPVITDEDIQAAIQDPLRTDFGGSDNQHGENRAEISSPAASIDPIDLEEFQKGSVLALFMLLLPLIKLEDKKEILQHLATVPHGI